MDPSEPRRLSISILNAILTVWIILVALGLLFVGWGFITMSMRYGAFSLGFAGMVGLLIWVPALWGFRLVRQWGSRPNGSIVGYGVLLTAYMLWLAMILPSFFRARKRSEAVRILEDLRMIDAAMDQYAVDHGKKPGDAVSWSDVQAYLKAGTTLYRSEGVDMLGGRFVIQGVGVPPKVSASTMDTLSHSAPPEFWSPFY